VNVVVLPYRSVTDAPGRLSELGQRLSLLIKLSVLSQILEYGSIGAVQMEAPLRPDTPDSCDPERIIPQVLGQKGGSQPQIMKGNGVVFVWGVLYEEDEDIVVQTYVRFLRRDTPETLKMRAGDLEFQARPNTAIVGFEPRQFTKQLFHSVEASYARADFVRKSPSDSAPGEALPQRVANCERCGATAFGVKERKGEWIHVTWLDPQGVGTRDGWIHSSGGLAGQSLNEVLPELSFIQGTVGYLRQRIADARGERLPKALAEHTRQDFESFLRKDAAVQIRSAAAVANQLTGIVALLQAGAEDLALARHDFDAAVHLAPYDANAIALATITKIAVDWNKTHSITGSKAVADRLVAWSALSDDPTLAIDNLRNFYKLLQTGNAQGTAPELSSQEVADRLREVQRVRVGPK
jgi:hypothetical protein